MMTYLEEVLGGFTQRLGLNTLEFDEEGICNLYVDSSHMIFLRVDEEKGVLMLFGGLGTLEEEGLAESCRAILEANQFWQEHASYSMSLIPHTQNVLLTSREPLEALDAERLYEWFNRFVGIYEIYREKLPRLKDEISKERDWEASRGDRAEEYAPAVGELV